MAGHASSPADLGSNAPLVIRLIGFWYLAYGGWKVLKQFFTLLQEIGGAFISGNSFLWMKADSNEIWPQVAGYQPTPAALALFVNLLVYGIMAIAGWKLLKTNKKAIRWASVSSVLTTLLNGLIVLTVLQMMRDFYSTAKLFMSSQEDMERLISLFSSHAQLMKLILPMYFPPLALYFLNRKQPRRWLAHYGR